MWEMGDVTSAVPRVDNAFAPDFPFYFPRLFMDAVEELEVINED